MNRIQDREQTGMTDRVDILENARLVLPDRVETGWLAVVDGRIAEIGAESSSRTVPVNLGK